MTRNQAELAEIIRREAEGYATANKATRVS
jgi:hypothetical protein